MRLASWTNRVVVRCCGRHSRLHLDQRGLTNWRRRRRVESSRLRYQGSSFQQQILAWTTTEEIGETWEKDLYNKKGGSVRWQHTWTFRTSQGFFVAQKSQNLPKEKLGRDEKLLTVRIQTLAIGSQGMWRSCWCSPASNGKQITQRGCSVCFHHIAATELYKY